MLSSPDELHHPALNRTLRQARGDGLPAAGEKTLTPFAFDSALAHSPADSTPADAAAGALEVAFWNSGPSTSPLMGMAARLASAKAKGRMSGVGEGGPREASCAAVAPSANAASRA